MNLQTRKIIGAVILGAAIAAAVVLQISAVKLVSSKTVWRSSTPTMTVADVSITFHWPVLPLGVIALAGLLCIVLPKRKNNE